MKENKKEEVVVKRKFKFVKFLVVILILYIILFLGYKLFTAKINNIFILNNNYLTDQEVIDESGLRNYPSFLLTTKHKIRKNLLKNSLIKDVKIKKKLWGIVYIEISEYEPLFIYQDKVILDNGTKINNNDYILPILINDVNEEILTKFINKYKDIDKGIKMQISEIEYLPNDIDKERFLFTMNDGNYVYITIYKTLAINEYNKIVPELEGKKGILYLDSGNYFEILS